MRTLNQKAVMLLDAMGVRSETLAKLKGCNGQRVREIRRLALAPPGTGVRRKMAALSSEKTKELADELWPRIEGVVSECFRPGYAIESVEEGMQHQEESATDLLRGLKGE